MADNVGPVKKDPYGKIKVSETVFEKDKEKFSEKEEKKKFSIFLAFFISVIQKMLKLLKSEKSNSSADNLLLNSIVELKSHLKKMQDEDVSSNLEFFKTFSKEWKKMLKIFHLTKIEESKKDLLQTLIDEFQKFPEDKRFSLSYYLKSYQDEGFIAQPAIEMLQALHSNHQDNPNHSVLKKWIVLLNKIITS